MVVIEEDDNVLATGEMALDAVDDLGDATIVLEDDLNMALLTSDKRPPIGTIPLKQRPLLLHFTSEPPKEVSVDVVAIKEVSVDEIVVKEAPIDPDVHKLASNCRMDFNIPIGVVF
ncbi:hypothetical protein AMTR_s00090p00114000 [Amborella trichopoda]|uniref:Uncharacterized protein n=1 Tax=Amborella trichopoda TaxID=13333 RepID=W1NVJ7_AMBTC|nr:hypothetical protein AMTR_s00090p00114000 [Amborella trichopoda]